MLLRCLADKKGNPTIEFNVLFNTEEEEWLKKRGYVIESIIARNPSFNPNEYEFRIEIGVDTARYPMKITLFKPKLESFFEVLDKNLYSLRFPEYNIKARLPE